MRWAAIALLLAVAWPGAVRAAASCSFQSSGGTLLAFGSYSGLGGDLDAIGQVNIQCVPDLLSGLAVTYTLAANRGTGSSFDPRRLTAGAYALDYNMYLDPSRTQVWGDGSPGTSTVAGACAAICTVLVYGRIFGGQSVPSGPYQDDILVTLDF